MQLPNDCINKPVILARIKINVNMWTARGQLRNLNSNANIITADIVFTLKEAQRMNTILAHADENISENRKNEITRSWYHNKDNQPGIGR